MAGDNDPPHEEGVRLIKATEAQLVEQVRAQAGRLTSSFTSSVAIYRESRTILDMSAEHATAMIEMKRVEFAVPEEQRTIRSRQQTVRMAIVAFVVLVVAVLVYLNPASGPYMAGLVAILGGGIVFSEYFNREKRKELPPPRKV